MDDLPTEAEMLSRFLSPGGLALMAALARAYLPARSAGRAIVLLHELKESCAAVDDLAEMALREDPMERWIRARAARLARQRMVRAAKAAWYAPLRFGDGALQRIVSGAGKAVLDGTKRN